MIKHAMATKRSYGNLSTCSGSCLMHPLSQEVIGDFEGHHDSHHFGLKLQTHNLDKLLSNRMHTTSEKFASIASILF